MRGLWLGAVVAVVTSTATAGETVRREDFRVATRDGYEIAVRELASGAVANGPPLVLLHGARVPGIASFDLPVPGGSFAGDLAAAGHRVYVMDARGYGGSTRPAALEQPSPANPPQVRVPAVARDIDAVVDAATARSGHGQVALIGWATGGMWAGFYAALYPERVSHLVLLNALHGGADRHAMLNTATTGAYRLNEAGSLLPGWDRSIPTEDKAAWRDPDVAAAYVRLALASDPTTASRNPPSFRAPSGALEDSGLQAAGRQLYDASHITARVLVVRSVRDFWSRPEDADTLVRQLTRAASVRRLDLADATHFVHLDRPERGRAELLAAIGELLAAP